jgi:hypothetical protein
LEFSAAVGYCFLRPAASGGLFCSLLTALGCHTFGPRLPTLSPDATAAGQGNRFAGFLAQLIRQVLGQPPNRPRQRDQDRDEELQKSIKNESAIWYDGSPLTGLACCSRLDCLKTPASGPEFRATCTPDPSRAASLECRAARIQRSQRNSAAGGTSGAGPPLETESRQRMGWTAPAGAH